ncbi:hypothetical protein MSAN_01585600 [Mycena sanguinolenta]|uniref:Ricin B lectin domain-containing protein n=1 Tax=Mycena sanguinolenta TaxID=230812 RepID=A0A8H6Y4B4_9AGAR|nr:hypothetical protein MSAN_01585600 [Mycena sanguinolenta]
MFHKIFAFGLGALAVARAASFQTPMSYCAANKLEKSHPAHGPMVAAIPNGVYAIHPFTNPETSLQASRRRDQPVYFAATRQPPSPDQRWTVEPNENFEYTLTNVATQATVYATYEDELFAGYDEAQGFHVQPIGLGDGSGTLYVIKVLKQDRVMTLIEGSTAALTPYGQPAGSDTQFWRMERLD